MHSLSIYCVLVRLLVNDGIGPEEQQLLTSGFRTVQKPQTSRRLLAFFAQGCRSVHVDRLEENVQMFMGKCLRMLIFCMFLLLFFLTPSLHARPMME